MRGIPVLRPMEFGDILDGAFKLYRAQFAAFLGASLIVYLPSLALEGWIVSSVDSADAAGMAGATLLRAAFSIVTVIVVYGVLTYQADQALQGTPVSAGGALRGALPRLLPLSAAYVLMGLGMVLGLLLLIVPGILLALMWFAITPAVVVEGSGPLRAFSRSRALARGALLRIGGVLLVASLITALPTFLTSMAAGVVALLSGGEGGNPMGMMAAVSATQILVTAAAAPFSVAVLLLLYYDRRIRTEALDVQIAAERLVATPV